MNLPDHMKRSLLLALTLVAGLFYPFGKPAAEPLKMVALVIGNSQYQFTDRLSVLKNPGNDADLVGKTLIDLGFQLSGGGVQHSLDLKGMRDSLAVMANDAKAADVALIYYAGHGIQISEENYLIPIDANPHSVSEAEQQMISGSDLLSVLTNPHIKVRILILDACRDNPFNTRGLTLSGGLNSMSGHVYGTSLSEGTFIWFATGAGKTSQDGDGNNGPLATAFSETIVVKGKTVYDVFNTASLMVIDSTHPPQYPAFSAMPMRGTFYFVSANTGRSEFITSEADAQPPVDRLKSVFANGVATSSRKFTFGDDYLQVNNSLDAPFNIPAYEQLPRADEFGDDDVRYFWVPVSSLPFLVSALIPDGLGNHCIAPESYFVFFFKNKKLFHVSMRFSRSGQCTKYDWVWNLLFRDQQRTTTVSSGSEKTAIVAHEETSMSILEVTRTGISDSGVVFHP